MANIPKADRAKLFAPFDALKGLREALAERERIRVPKIELSDEMLEELDRKLRFINCGEILTVIYYDNEEYIKITGMVSKISEISRSLTIVNTLINFDDIKDIHGNFPDNLL